jgi:hypothetical protein
LAPLFLSLFALALVFPCPAQGSNLSFSLKLYGGLNNLSGGDFNTGLQGMNDLDGKYFWFFGLTKTGGAYNPVHWGMTLGGDLILQITPAWGIGLGTGFLQGNQESSITYGPVTAGDDTTAKLSAIPIRLEAYYTVPTESRIKVCLHGGLGYYLAKMSYDLRSYAATSWTRYAVQADGGGLGFQGGLGLEFKLSPALSLFLEGQGRYASLSGFDGTLDFLTSSGAHLTRTGKVYFYRMTTVFLGTFPLIVPAGTAPSGSGISDVREAKLDFSGFSVVAGFVVHF